MRLSGADYKKGKVNEVKIKIIYGMISAVLCLLAAQDIRKKEISVRIMLLLGVLCLTGCLFLPQKNLWSMAGGVAAGLCMIGISLLSQGQIGMGDGIVITLLGALLGGRGCLVMLCTASCIMAVVSIGVLLCKKGGRQTTLPFVPALLGGYIMTLAVL